MNGKYIVIEGHDGVGKSTQVELLAEYLRGQGHQVLATREPGGGDLESTKVIREILKNKEYDLAEITNVLLFTADRYELWTKVIEPALKQGKTVISDRNWWSTLSFEHSGMGVDRELIVDITRRCLPTRYVEPDIGIILELKDDERVKRMRLRDDSSSADAFESRPDDFQQRVAAGYLEIARDFGIPVVDAAPEPGEIHRAIVKTLGR